MTTMPPRELENLRAAISEHYPTLSKRLQQIAQFALEHPNEMALETIAVIAGRAGTQPSAMIRFAKAFGYKGFSEMQRVFRSRLMERAPSYSERQRLFRDKHNDPRQRTPHTVLREFASASIVD
jgi:DNA-binding MurR/RpiR family transcriptional regulator